MVASAAIRRVRAMATIPRLNPTRSATDVSITMNSAQRRRVWTFSGAIGALAVLFTFIPSAAPLSGRRTGLWCFVALAVAVAL